MRFQIHRQYFNVAAGDLLIIGSTFFTGPSSWFPSDERGRALFLPKAVWDGRQRRGCGISDALSGPGCGFSSPGAGQDKHSLEDSGPDPADLRELPARSIRSRLNARTYLKMILVFSGTITPTTTKVERFRRKQENIERLRPVLVYRRAFRRTDHGHEAASMVHMSRSHFMRFFKNVTGQAFVAYLHHLRVAKRNRCWRRQTFHCRVVPAGRILRSELLWHGISKSRHDPPPVSASVLRNACQPRNRIGSA